MSRYDHLNGKNAGDYVDTRLHFDEGEDKLYIARVQDVEPILEANKRQFEVDDKRHKSEAFNHVARIPMVVVEKHFNETGVNLLAPGNEKYLRDFLNSNENRFLRTKPGKL